jgi:hypothetical protein
LFEIERTDIEVTQLRDDLGFLELSVVN